MQVIARPTDQVEDIVMLSRWVLVKNCIVVSNFVSPPPKLENFLLESF
jgi:hypothetical protein